MGSRNVVAIVIAGALVLTGIIVALVLWQPETPAQQVTGAIGQRLLAHSRDRNDYRLFVGVPSASPAAWLAVAAIDDSSVTLRDAQVLELSKLTAYFVAYPSGALVDHHGPDELYLPEWVRFPQESNVPDVDILTAADLQEGRSLVRIEFGKSTSQPRSEHSYSTTLTNISGMRVRVLRFGGYTKAGDGFSLSTITSQFFTAEDFMEWYGQDGEWIEPGKSVTDPNNYGSPPVMWAYYCEIEGGRQFITGGVIE